MDNTPILQITQEEFSLDDEIENFFKNQPKEEIIPHNEVYGRRILEKAENAYFSFLQIYDDQMKRIADTKDKIKENEKALEKCKNIKNHKKAGLNKERSKKRKKLRAEIEKLKLELSDLEGAQKQV